MRLLISLFLFSQWLAAQQFGYASIQGPAGPWSEIFGNVGLIGVSASEASILIARPGTPMSPGVIQRIEAGAFLILEGDSPLGRAFGFATRDRISRIASLIDTHQPDMRLVLETPVDVTDAVIPADAQVFTREKWTGAPIVAGLKRGQGGILWVATSPGKHGYERFPFLVHALSDIGFDFPFRGNGLWAFFDYAYRARVDVNWFAKRWHKAGIAALHVAAWQFYDPDQERGKYLRELIAACHREGVLVYAWLELPHVSERFWSDHPEWREKTALQQDAQLDWRKLMNLADPACFAAVREGIAKLIQSFDWDGVNFAELYYESLEGAANPARFTPLNDIVRAKFQAAPNGFDPLELWGSRKDAQSLRRFLDYRAQMARELQLKWLTEADRYRLDKPYLDVVLTHVDDRLDVGMRDAIGADTSNVPDLAKSHRFTLLVEDPATLWNRGPERYSLIAAKYQDISNVAVDVNIVDRYQDVYPSKKQVGAELFGLVHIAEQSFGRVGLYVENSIENNDLLLITNAAAHFTKATWIGSRLVVDSSRGGGVRWDGECLVDGKQWPIAENQTVWLSAGTHTLERTSARKRMKILSSSNPIKTAEYRNEAITFQYSGQIREIARFDSALLKATLDGKPVDVRANTFSLVLPSGSHAVIAWPQKDESGVGSSRDSRQAILSDRGSQQAGRH